MTIDDFLNIDWTVPGLPLIEPPIFSPVIADPTFLFPEETPSGQWELFAHTAWGLHRFSSEDGVRWRDHGLSFRHAMRPFLRRVDGEYLLLFESYSPFALPLTALPGVRPWRSEIRLARSLDLVHWSSPETVLTPSLEWMKDPALGNSVSNPCLIEGFGDWRLYFSASLAWIPDCGFSEPRYIGAARGISARGPFESSPLPLLDPSFDLTPGVLGAGAIKVLRMDDGWIGLQNKIYRDSGGRSRSAIFVLRSVDGLAWVSSSRDPLLAPSSGWTCSHVYACDARCRESDGLWYLYFNARDGWKISEGRERVGRILGRPR